jgi:signal transduction histidine kinase
VKTTFLATVSHELRTPLVAIIGYIDLMLEGVFGTLSPEQENAVTRVQSAGTNLYQLIAGLLDASRIDLGQETVELGDVDLDTLMRDLRAEFSGSRTVQVYFPRQVDVPVLSTDAAKLRRILASLLENAVRYTERGVVTVDVRWDPVHDRVELRVSDTGPGIPEDQFEAIFQAFHQGADRPHAIANGVGLGLYIVRRLVTLLGGEVSVASRVGEGSTFTVSLPRRPLRGAAATPQRALASLAH